MHDWNEELGAVSDVLGGITEVSEEIFKSLEILVVLVCLISGSLDFLLQLAEWTSVG